MNKSVGACSQAITSTICKSNDFHSGNMYDMLFSARPYEKLPRKHFPTLKEDTDFYQAGQRSTSAY